MKKLFAISAAVMLLVMFSLSALAQETNNWTGLYVGWDAGYGSGRWDVFTYGDDGEGPGATYYNPKNSQGILGGVEAGYNWEHRNIIFGVVGNFSLASISGSKAFSDSSLLRNGLYAGSNKSTLTRVGTLRGRLGYILGDRMLVYGTGGFVRAQGKMEAEASYYVSVQKPVVPSTYASKQTRNATGWVWGFGAEYAMNSRWSVNAEILRLQMEDVDYENAIDPFTVVRFGVNLRL